MIAMSIAWSPPPAYEPGACNIGPAEIAARRRAGHLGVLATVVGFVILVALDAPPAWRIVLFLPAAGAAAGYLQAWFRFCANFGFRGVFNFTDRLRDVQSVVPAGARARDRRKALQVIGVSALAGAVVAVAATLLPV